MANRPELETGESASCEQKLWEIPEKYKLTTTVLRESLRTEVETAMKEVELDETKRGAKKSLILERRGPGEAWRD